MFFWNSLGFNMMQQMLAIWSLVPLFSFFFFFYCQKFCQESTLVIANTSNNTREDYTHENNQMIITKIRLIIFFAAKDGETLYNQWKEDQELTVAQIMNSLLPNSDLKVGKTTRPCRYDLNQIPYNYTVEVTNRFKGLDLKECLKNYGWSFVTLYRRQWLRKTIKKDHPQEKERQKGKMVVWRRPYK